MVMEDRRKRAFIVLQGLAYFIVDYTSTLLLASFLFKNDLMIFLASISETNILSRICGDLAVRGIPLICLILLMFKNKISWSDIGLKISRKKIGIGLQIGLAAVYLGIFLFKGDYTCRGLYAALYYLFVVAMTEELIFRGFLFHWFMRSFSKNTSMVLSGLLFGLMHSIMPIVLLGVHPLVALLSNALGGIFAGAIYSVIYLRTGTLLVPILIHAILDYSGVVW
jgi:membrane protease YdiL (CAAX protease family)